MTYNVHSCRGTDGKVDPARIAEVIAAHDPDVVGLQELDVGRRRSGGVDQAVAIAAHLNMKLHFHPAMKVRDELYGDAILTSLPNRLVKASGLPSIGEPRGALWLCLDVEGRPVNVINTHFGLWRRERIRQAETLLGPGWLGHPQVGEQPTILMGDFNSVPSSAAYRLLSRQLTEVQSSTGGRPRATFPSRYPMLRIDHIFLSAGMTALSAEVPSNLRARIASDHLPLLATVELPADARPEGRERVPATT